MKKAISGRRAARMLVIQGLYAWLINQEIPHDLEQELLSSHYFEMLSSFDKAGEASLPTIKQIDTPYFRNILHGIIENKETLDQSFVKFLDRNIDQLGPIEYAILLLGAYELFYRPDVPYKVVINEAVDIAKLFGAQDAHKYINGVLDQLALAKNKLRTNKEPA